MSAALHVPTKYRSWLTILVAALLLQLAACSGSPSEEALKAALDQLQESGENRDLDTFMDLVADDFSGNGGEFDRDGMERLLRLIAMRHKSIGVTRTSTTIQMHGELAEVSMSLLITGGSGGMLPETGQLMETKSSWRFEDGEWQVTSATWKPVQ